MKTPDEATILKMAQWLHHWLSAAQNSPWEEGEVCEDCIQAVRKELLPIIAESRKDD
jgi:hypothetical protein